MGVVGLVVERWFVVGRIGRSVGWHRSFACFGRTIELGLNRRLLVFGHRMMNCKEERREEALEICEGQFVTHSLSTIVVVEG